MTRIFIAIEILFFFFSCQEDLPFDVYMNKTDTDIDGLPDSLEKSVGTSVYEQDTDGDGLSDYYEIRKYNTDPLNSDSDNDGIDDSDWDERREYTYSINVILELRWPFDPDFMNDFYQDTKILEYSGEVTILEVVLYPEAKAVMVEQPYIPKYNSIYTQKTYRKDYTREIINTAKSIIPDNASLRFAVDTINEYIKDNFVYNYYFTPFFIYTDNQGNIIYREKYFFAPSEDPYAHSWQEIKEKTIFASTMFYNKTYGDCLSYSTIHGAFYRAAGIEERTILTIPLNFRYESDNTKVILKDDYYKDYQENNTVGFGPEDVKHQEGYLIQHFTEEIRIGYFWYLNDGSYRSWLALESVDDLWIRLCSVNDITEFTEAYIKFNNCDPDFFFNNRPYKYISIIEMEAMH